MTVRRKSLWSCGTALLLALLCAAGGASARHGESSNGGTPGRFDYYLLSLSWSPAYCLDSPDSEQCNGTRRYGFIVHGLWPQYERGSPQHCDVHVPVPDGVVLDMADLMPARGLVYHEWSAHGTCSGLEPAAFFALVRRAYGRIAIPREFSDPAAGIERATESISESFQRANPHLPADAVVVTCTRQQAPRLREVRICLDRSLTPRACSADVLRAACRAPQLIVPPIR